MLSLREAMIVVPKADNRGTMHPYVLNAVTRQCIAHFGGATILSAEGAWMGDDKLHQEPVWLVMTAMEPTADNVNILFGIVDYVIAEMEQEAVYVRLPDGTAYIRDKVARVAEALAAAE